MAYPKVKKVKSLKAAKKVSKVKGVKKVKAIKKVGPKALAPIGKKLKKSTMSVGKKLGML